MAAVTSRDVGVFAGRGLQKWTGVCVGGWGGVLWRGVWSSGCGGMCYGGLFVWCLGGACEVGGDDICVAYVAVFLISDVHARAYVASSVCVCVCVW